MEHPRRFLDRWKSNRLTDHHEVARGLYVLYETAWANAWPHLDDWFKPEGPGYPRMVRRSFW